MTHASLIRARRSLLTVGGAALLVAGCATTGSSPSASVASLEPSAPASAPAASEEAGEAYVVNVAKDATLGDILVGEDGKTLYVFTKDTGGKSVCNDECATNWPPFVLEEGETVTAGEGVTGALASIARDDGTMQVTYAGAPLYYFAKDAAAGDVKGQGINDVWFVATPSGASGSRNGGNEYSRGGGSASPSP